MDEEKGETGGRERQRGEIERLRGRERGEEGRKRKDRDWKTEGGIGIKREERETERGKGEM